MSDIAFSMSLDQDRWRLKSRTCQDNYKKGAISAAVFTILYSCLCVGLVVDNLVNMSHSITDDDVIAREGDNLTRAEIEYYKKELFHQNIVTRVMYAVLAGHLLLLVVSSVGLLKGVYKRKQSLIMTWMLSVLIALLYAAVVIIRDYQLEGETASVYTKTILYVIFFITELTLIKHAVTGFREVRKGSNAANTSHVVRYESNNPDRALFTISDAVQPPDPESLFKLPTYEEVISENAEYNAPNNTDEDQADRDKVPPSSPPPYSP